MDEPRWELFIKEIQSNQSIQNLSLGICVYSTNHSDDLASKYLIELGINAGFINVFTSYKKSLESILKILTALEARGKRKYIRVQPQNGDTNTYIQVFDENNELRGEIKDVSIYALVATFNSHYFSANQILRRCIVKLKGVMMNCDLIVKGFTESDPNTYILIFVHKADETRNKVYDYIYERIQKNIIT